MDQLGEESIPLLEERMPRQEEGNSPPMTVNAPSVPQIAASSSKKAQELTDQVLRFLSTASNETLVACLVAICASTYFVLGRVGLVLLGVGGGIVLHASWEGSNGDGQSVEPAAREVKRRREMGVAVAQKVLNWRETKVPLDTNGGNGEANQNVIPSSKKELDFKDFQPATGAALQTLTEAVVRDYVKWWYGPILPSEDKFLFSCRQMLNKFVLSVSSHLSRKRPADTFLDFLTNSSSIIIVFLNELSAALMSPEALSSSPAEAVITYLEKNPEGNLSNVLSRQQQKRKLVLVADDILQNFLDPVAYNCDPVKVFLREIFAGVALESTIANTSRAEWINEWIVYLLEEADPEIMNAIDAGVNSATTGQLTQVPGQEVGSEPSNIAAKPVRDQLAQDSGHRRRMSRAEDAMEQAMMEAKRLSEMIAAEDAMRSQETTKERSGAVSETSTTVTADDLATPTSSDSDRNGFGESSVEIPERPPPDLSDPPHPTTPKTDANFTNFDQLSSWKPPTPAAKSLDQPIFTLHNAHLSILDDSMPGEKAKPTSEFLLQVEPISSGASGWMIPRSYQDFEALHEVLRRISQISGVSAFTKQHSILPVWKGQAKTALRIELERYLQSALKYDLLAESGGMKKFLNKDQGLGKNTSANKPAFGFPSSAAFETMGKGVLDVLGNAPKGIAGGGKAVLGGVTGVFGAVGGSGQKKPSNNSQPKPKTASTPGRSRGDSVGSFTSSPSIRKESQEGQAPPRLSESSANPPPLPQRPSERSSIQAERSSSSLNLVPEEPRPTLERLTTDERAQLPPPPSAIADDYETTPALSSYTPSSPKPPVLPQRPPPPSKEPSKNSQPEENATNVQNVPMTEEETQVAVELFFAVIQELYTLSSAWNIRRTLLNAAKTFLLRPGNPNLESIRLLLQTSMIDANTSDAGVASHLLKIRENTLPTEEELKAWPPPPSDEEKLKLRNKARKLLVERGMPQALTSVMGAAASGEALGRVFDCLQVEEVARGLMFALLLQALRATTQ